MSARTQARTSVRTGRVGAVVLGAFVVVASAFVVSIGYTLHRAKEAGQGLPAIVQRDVSAIAHATVLRSDLQQVEEMLSESTDGHPWEPGAMRRVLERIDRESGLARTTYADDVDPRLRGAAFESITLARRGVEPVRASLDAGRVEDARGQMHTTLRPHLKEADAALAMLLRASMDELASAAEAQVSVRERATRTALALDALCVVLAFGFGALAVATVGREHARLRVRLAELEVFADRVAHDIRGPLTPVSFALTEAARGAVDPLRSFVERAERSLRVVLEIIDGLHSFARSQTEPHPDAHADVRPVIEDVVAETMQEAERCDVQLVVLGIEDAVVRCETGVLASIASNLVRNAIRHMDGRSPRRVTVSVRVHATEAALVVQDTGPGLPAGFEERAFLPYTRAEGTLRAGLGLGLATVKRLAEARGGSVHVQSTSRGCTFTVALPTASRATVAPQVEAAHAR